MTGTFMAVSGKPGATIKNENGSAFQLVSPQQFNQLVAAIGDAKPVVNLPEIEPKVEVKVDSPEIKVENIVETPEVHIKPRNIVKNEVLVQFSAKHVYWAVVIQTLLIFILGTIAYVGLPKLDKYIDARYGSINELSE